MNYRLPDDYLMPNKMDYEDPSIDEAIRLKAKKRMYQAKKEAIKREQIKEKNISNVTTAF
jgi:hypothetical protein